MKFYALLFIIIASMFTVVSCTTSQRRAEVVEIVPIQPVEKYVTLEMGKSTFDSVRNELGEPEKDNASDYGKYTRTSWYYKFGKQNVILVVSVIDKNGTVHKNILDLRKSRRSFFVYFNNGILDRASL